jgi:hypothetical protein
MRFGALSYKLYALRFTLYACSLQLAACSLHKMKNRKDKNYRLMIA